MTVSELYRQVAGLGFESSLESDDRFYEAANRALLQVSDVRPAVRYYTINHKPLTNVIGRDTFTPVESSATFDAIRGKAYYFEADGNGLAHIEHVDNGEVTLIETLELKSNRAFVPYRGFFKKAGYFVEGNVRIRFDGNYTYSIRNVAIYDKIYSGDVKDIPAYEPYTRYDISKCVNDFLGLEAPPITDDASHSLLNQNYFVENGRVILLPYDGGGCYKVAYKHRPTRINDEDSAEANEDKIDLDDDLAELMSLAVAIYVLAEDESDLVNHYSDLYQRRVSEIVSRQRDYAPIKITTNGW